MGAGSGQTQEKGEEPAPVPEPLVHRAASRCNTRHTQYTHCGECVRADQPFCVVSPSRATGYGYVGRLSMGQSVLGLGEDHGRVAENDSPPQVESWACGRGACRSRVENADWSPHFVGGLYHLRRSPRFRDVLITSSNLAPHSGTEAALDPAFCIQSHPCGQKLFACGTSRSRDAWLRIPSSRGSSWGGRGQRQGVGPWRKKCGVDSSFFGWHQVPLRRGEENCCHVTTASVVRGVVIVDGRGLADDLGLIAGLGHVEGQGLRSRFSALAPYP